MGRRSTLVRVNVGVIFVVADVENASAETTKVGMVAITLHVVIPVGATGPLPATSRRPRVERRRSAPMGAAQHRRRKECIVSHL